jgi:Phytanoyl-CoA dioxygenase (PhyH)
VKTPVPVSRIDDLAQDLAARHRRTTGAGDHVDKALVDADLAHLARDGYLILPNLITAEECAEVRRAVRPLLRERGRNAFEGIKTRRVYSVVAKTRAVDRLVDHPRVLALLDRLLDPNYLLSQLQVIDIGAGESAQMEHFDDAMYPIARPRPALSAATVWAVDDFTPDNGATVVLPGSHHWDSQRRPATRTSVARQSCPPGHACSSWAPCGTAAAPTPRTATGSPSPPSTASPGCGPRKRLHYPPRWTSSGSSAPTCSACSATAFTHRSWAPSTGCTHCACSPLGVRNPMNEPTGRRAQRGARNLTTLPREDSNLQPFG